MAEMPIAIQQRALLHMLSRSTHSPCYLALCVSVVREYRRVFRTRRSHLVGAGRSWEMMIFLAVMLNCICGVGA